MTESNITRPLMADPKKAMLIVLETFSILNANPDRDDVELHKSMQEAGVFSDATVDDVQLAVVLGMRGSSYA